jgi:transcription elongation factor Elf1
MKISKPLLLLVGQRWRASFPCPVCRHGNWDDYAWGVSNIDGGWIVRCPRCGAEFEEIIRKRRIRPWRAE